MRYILLVLITLLLIMCVVWFIVRKKRTDMYREIDDMIESLPQADPSYDLYPTDLMYCIYMDKRKEKVKKALKSFNIKNCNFIPAVKGDDLSFSELYNSGVLHPQCEIILKLNIDRVGCYLSHIKVLEEFLKTDEEMCLIFEDDIQPLDPSERDVIFNRLRLLTKEIEDLDFDIIYFGKCWEFWNKETPKGLTQLRDTIRPVCAHAYLVTRKFAEIILENAFPIEWTIDVLYLKLLRNGHIKGYTVAGSIFDQTLGDTLLESPEQMEYAF
jgi:hypothetical protein